MSREELREDLSRMLEEEMGEGYPSLADDVGLKGGLNLDSVDIVGLVIRIERELRIGLSMTDLEQVRTVGDLLDLLTVKLATQGLEDTNLPARFAEYTPKSSAA